MRCVWNSNLWDKVCSKISTMIFVVLNQDVKDLTLLSYQSEANFHLKYNQNPDFSHCWSSARPQRRVYGEARRAELKTHKVESRKNTFKYYLIIVDGCGTK